MKHNLQGILILFSLILGLAACDSSSTPSLADPSADSLATQKMLPGEATVSNDSTSELPMEGEKIPTVDSAAYHFFAFDLLTLRVDQPELLMVNPSPQQTEAKPIDVNLRPHSLPSGHLYYLADLDSSVQSVEVYQRYMTTMALIGEGMYLELTDWRHHLSDWELLEKMGDTLITPGIIKDETTQFPDIPVKEIVKETKRIEKEELKTEDRYWSKLAKTIEKPGKLPSKVGISKLSLKIVITLKDGTQETRMLNYEIPLHQGNDVRKYLEGKD